MNEIVVPKNIEKIESEGDSSQIWGIKSCKSYRGYLQSKINGFVRNSNKEMEMCMRGLLMAYNQFHPELKASVEIRGWKGKSGFDVKEYPNYFEVIEYRKEETNAVPKKITHKVYRNSLNRVLKVIKNLMLGEKQPTKTIARLWAKENKIWVNKDGKKIFDSDGFNFANISGCRATYFDFYYPLKILEFYKMIKYYKSGHIEKISNSVEFQVSF